MVEWWIKVGTRLDWEDPSFLLSVVTALVTALIPIFLWRLGENQADRDHRMRVQQSDTLHRVERIAKRQRRDALISILDEANGSTHLNLLWLEVREYDGHDRRMLKHAFRSNVQLALPGGDHGPVNVNDDLEDDEAVADYVASFGRRYSDRGSGYNAYGGLLSFLEYVRALRLSVNVEAIVDLVTGATAEVQRPAHSFFRELVTILPESASSLLNRIESIDYRSSGGIRLNVLTGTLLAIKDIELGRTLGERSVDQRGIQKLRSSVPTSLATLLHRGNLRSLDRWSLEGSTEPVSATLAWLIRAVGWFADVDDHLAWRMVQNLADAIISIPEAERGWGIDDKDVRKGFDEIRLKQPILWESYGKELESAALLVGEWRRVSNPKES